MRESLKKIETEFEEFFEFPTGNTDSVTSTSARLFAEHCVNKIAKQYLNQMITNNINESKTLLEKLREV